MIMIMILEVSSNVIDFMIYVDSMICDSYVFIDTNVSSYIEL